MLYVVSSLEVVLVVVNLDAVRGGWEELNSLALSPQTRAAVAQAKLIVRRGDDRIPRLHGLASKLRCRPRRRC